MSCYYPLLGLPDGIDAGLTYSSHTLNQCAQAHQTSPQQHDLDLALYGSRDREWILYDKLKVPIHGDREVRASTYGLAPGELLVAVPLPSNTRTEPRTTILPRPATKRVDRSPVAERCNLAFHWRGIISSYQGNIPCAWRN